MIRIGLPSFILIFLLTIVMGGCRSSPESLVPASNPVVTSTESPTLPPPPTPTTGLPEVATPTTQAAEIIPTEPPPAPPTQVVVRSQVQRYSCLWADQAQTTPVYTFEVINTYEHDPSAYTQGLIFRDGILYEGTGLYGQSSLREVVLESGQVEQKISLAEQFFGEGITELDGKIYQLTWKEQTGFIYDPTTFEQLATFSYPTEGWGLTHDGQKLLMSDGSETLYFLDPETLQKASQVTVSAEGMLVPRLNELEYVEGEVWANVYQTSCIARIDPASGQVLGWIDISGILSMKDLPGSEVPNGIAYDSTGQRLFVTGKYWPKLFEIRVVKR